MERIAVRTLLNVFGAVSVVVILFSVAIYFTVESLLTYASVGLLGGMVCLLIYIAVSFERLSSFFSRQSTKYGLNMLATIIVLLAIIGIVEVIGARNNKRFDLTKEKSLTLSPLTKKVLLAMDQKVEVTVFYQRDQAFEFRDLLKRYSDITDKISYRFLSLNQNPGLAKEYGIASYGAIVVESAGGKRRKFNYCMEENITNGIISTTREKEEIIYFLAGHGERDFRDMDDRIGYSSVSSALETEGYAVRSLLLLRETRVPEDASVLIISGPKEECLPSELQAITDYVTGGGRVLFMLDPFTMPDLVTYLQDYNIMLGDDIVVDKESKLIVGDVFSPVASGYRKQHPITKNFGVATVFPLARSVEVLNTEKAEKVDAKPLVQTSPESWAETNRESIRKGEVYFQEWEDRKGPVSVVVVADVYGSAGGGKEKEVPKGRVVVCGDSDFASNLYFNVLGNKDLFLNIVNWLAEEEALISIRHRKDETRPFSPLFLTENQKKAVLWFSTVIPPLLTLSIGILIYSRRKMRG
jgi:ABC-type uncharacterized transport system involved in gliding motility auxiliary subunit